MVGCKLGYVVLVFCVSLQAHARPQEGPISAPDKKTTSIPKVPDCVQDQVENTLFGQIWQEIASPSEETEDSQCSERFVVLIPSGEKLEELSKSSENGENAFENDEVLRHLTLFSHIFRVNEEEFNALNDGDSLLSLNGMVANVVQSAEGMTISNMPTTLECSTDCMKIYDLEGVLAVSPQDLEFSLAPRFGGIDKDNTSTNEDENEEQQGTGQPDSKIIFRTLELPTLTDTLRQALEKELSGSSLAKIWSQAQIDMNTNLKEWTNYIVVVPTDQSLDKLSHGPNMSDEKFRERILSTHLIVREGRIPESILDRLPEDRDIIKINMMGQNVVFYKEQDLNGETIIRVNGRKVIKIVRVDDVDLFQIEEPLFLGADLALLERDTNEAASPGAQQFQSVPQNVQGPVSSRPNPHLFTAFIPSLPPALSFAMRQLGASRAASIWTDVKTVAQTGNSAQLPWNVLKFLIRTNVFINRFVAKADREDDLCSLPAEIGPCRMIVGRLFHNPETGKCEPFVYGGCEGNENRFESLLECSETCVTDLKSKQEVRAQVCALPVYLHENLEPLLKSGCTEEKGMKFHFNEETGQCDEVEYEGCFGTDNLFDTPETLAKIEEQTMELLDQVSADDGLCDQPKYLEDPGLGACRAQLPKWAFEDGQCTPFFYNGCGGTENQFELEEDCLKKCANKREDKTLYIYVPSDNALEDLYDAVGVGQEAFTSDILLGRRFVLNSLSRNRCDSDQDVITSLNQEFTIQCNNYVTGFKSDNYEVFISETVEAITRDDLESAKIAQEETKIDQRSGLAPVPVAVDAPLPSPNGAVKNLLRSLDLGNFADKWEAYKKIEDLESQESNNILCTLPKNEGNCRDSVGMQTRFYYDVESGFCRRFSFGGCGGNVNNFQTYDDCVNFCGKFQGRVAMANFEGVGQDGNSINGTLIFTQKTPKSQVIAKGQINGLSNGAHQIFFYTEAFKDGTCDPSKVDIEDKSIKQEPQSIRSQDGTASVELEDSIISLFGDDPIIQNGIAIQVASDVDTVKEAILAENMAVCTNVKYESNRKSATVTVVSTSNPELADNLLTLTQDGPDAPVKVQGQLFGLTPGKHGFHIHQNGDTGDECKAAGGHFNPFTQNHGAPHVTERHVGDLGNIVSTGSLANVDKEDFLSTLYVGVDGVTDRAIVIHAGEDDLGLGGDKGSLSTGNAGARVGCGIIQADVKTLKASAKLYIGDNTSPVMISMEQKEVTQEVTLSIAAENLEAGSYGLFTIPDADCNSFEGLSRHEILVGEFSKEDSKGESIDFASNKVTLEGYPSLESSPVVLRAAGSNEILACAMVTYDDEQNVIVIVPPMVEDLSKGNLRCHLIFGAAPVAPNEEISAQTLCFQEVTLFQDENGTLVVNNIPADKMDHKDGASVFQITAPFWPTLTPGTMAAKPNVGSGNKNNGLVEVRPRTLTLPEVDETLRAEATEELKLSIFFNIWDQTLKTDLAKLVEQPGTTFTIITVDDESFLDLADKSGSDKREFPDQELLNRFILANQVVGEKIDTDTLTEEPLRVKTVGGFGLTISNKEGERA
ncbi:hypothetical protein TCAL_04512 [Tigriopus californicus]|uniref:BPTI/Kunitz inhibitor domain-containing protein n=1 Tax=Tigriopus californicus TaxID=6832 RepID=A0A553PBV5_TIGCA|nr:hypothetical protein TCAL_04512 [Tigriopus californicus]